MIKVGILGCSGRMGESIALCAQEEECVVVAGSVSPSSEKKTYEYPVSTDAAMVFEKAHVVLDFSHFSAAPYHMRLAEETKKPLLIGTTGHYGGLPWSQEPLHTPACPIMYAQNTSMGIQLLIRSVVLFCRMCSDIRSYDISIVETHHQGKKDAPSGTALFLQDVLSSELQCPPVSISSVRRGNVPGKHEIIISNMEESFVFSHEAISRNLFARGALRCAKWLLQQKPGLYTLHTWMRHMMA